MLEEEKDKLETPEQEEQAAEEVQETTPADTTEETTEAAEEEVVESSAAVAEDSAEQEDDSSDDDVDLDGDDDGGDAGAHDDFDWSVSNKQSLPYSETEIETYLEQYESTLTKVAENEIVSGIVTGIQGGDVVLDINYKSDGLVPLSEFRDLPDLTVGDPIEVYVEKQEDERG
ncbi:MAG: S1 RNA-binding domain-containing protein, partial [Saprospiraceae bacterium]|nr:S1 RNA-binding domain-containing protein [Saprospiraceae bacterium]